MKSAEEFFKQNPFDNYLGYMIAPDGRIVDRNTLKASYANMMHSCDWLPETGEFLPSSVLVPESIDGVGEGSGDSSSSSSGKGGSGYGPIGPMTPDHDVANIGLSLIINGEEYNAGDQYACCTGVSDGYV